MHSVANLATLQTPLETFFPSKKHPNLVSENHGTAAQARGLALPARTHTSLSLSVGVRLLCSARTHLSLSLCVCSVQCAHTSLSLSLSLCVCSVQRAHTSLSLSASAQFLSQHAHTPLSHSLCVCSVSLQRSAERSSALIQLNTDIMLLL